MLLSCYGDLMCLDNHDPSPSQALTHRLRSHANRSRFSTGELDGPGSRKQSCTALLGTDACTGAESVRGVAALASRAFGLRAVPYFYLLRAAHSRARRLFSIRL